MNNFRMLFNMIWNRDKPKVLCPVQSFWSDHQLYMLVNELADPKKPEAQMGFCMITPALAGVDDSFGEKIASILSAPFPAGSMLQFTLFGSPDIYPFTDAVMGLRRDVDPIVSESVNSFLQAAIQEKVEMLTQHVNDEIESVNGSRVRNFYLVVSGKVPIVSGGVPTSKEISTIKDLRDRLKQGLDSIGLRMHNVNPELYLRIMHSVFNWSESALWKTGEFLYDERKHISKQVFDADMHLDDHSDHLKLGGKKIAVCLTPRRLPEHFSILNMAYLAGDPLNPRTGIRQNFIANLNIFYPDQTEKRQELDKHRNFLLTVNSRGGFEAIEPRIRYQRDSYDVLYESIEAGEIPVEIFPSFILFADDDKEASEATANMITNYRSLGLQLMEERAMALPVFLNSIPMFGDPSAVKPLERYHSLTTREASEFVPLVAGWRGTGTPVQILVNRLGEPMSFDLFDSPTNMNAVCAAESGSGKSFYFQDLIVTYLSIGGRVFVIDNGESYKKLNQMLEGTFISFERGRDICLNPFPMVRDYDDDADMLVGIVSTMAFPDGLKDPYQRAKLREVMGTVYTEHKGATTIDLIAEALKASNDQRVCDIGEQLYSFTSRGEYGKYFNGPNTVNMDNPFVVVELKDLDGRKHLQGVVLFQMLYQIQSACFGATEKELMRRKLCLADEAWEHLQRGESASFLEGFFRKCRKTGTATLIATQSIGDCYANPQSKAIVQNAANMLLLGQKRETVVQMEREGQLDIGKYGFDLLKTVKTYKDPTDAKANFSEVFLYTKNGLGVGRLIVSDLFKLLQTTNAMESAAIKEYEKQGYTLLEALKMVRDQRYAKRSQAA